MSEQEWLTGIEPTPMLDHLRGQKVSDRKLRLFAVACCRRVWNLLVDERSRKAVDVADEYADGLAHRERLIAARDEAREVKKVLRGPSQTPNQRAANAAFDATRDTGRSAGYNAAAEASRALNLADHNYCNAGELLEHANLLRCIFGNPLRPPALDTARLAPKVVALAQTIYDNRAFDQMPTLGDAIEEAGCTNTDILDHCRSTIGHVRGCWVVDALLGKA
jgi:hypothetical protein